MGLGFPHFWAIKEDSQRKTESRILITKLWRSNFPDSSSFCHLDFFPYILSFFPTFWYHLIWAVLLYYSLQYLQSSQSRLETYVGHMQEISRNDLMFTAPRGIRELKVGLGCPLVVPTFPGQQESHRGCECWLSWSPTNWDLSTLTRGCLLPCSIFCSARSISQIPHCRPHLAICSQCCPCDDDYSYTNPWSSMLWLSYSYSFRGFLQSVIYNSSSVLPHSGSILQLCFHS